MVNLGFRAFPGVVPVPNPQAPPGARYLQAEQAGVEAGPGPTPGSRKDAGRAPAGWASGTPRESGTWLWSPVPLPHAAVTLDRSLGLPVRWKRHEPREPLPTEPGSECLVNVTAALTGGMHCPQTILLRSLCLRSQCQKTDSGSPSPGAERRRNEPVPCPATANHHRPPLTLASAMLCVGTLGGQGASPQHLWEPQ